VPPRHASAGRDVVGVPGAVVATVDLPDYGTDVAASVDGRVYVPVRSGKLLVVDAKTASVAATIPIDGEPYAVAVTPGGRRVYVVDYLGQYVTVVTAPELKVKKRIPIGTRRRPSLRPSVVASRDGRWVYVADTARDHLLTIATDTDEVANDLFLDFHPAAVDVSPDGRFVYVAGCKLLCTDGTMFQIDTRTHAIVSQIALGPRPSAMVIGPEGRFAYFVNAYDANVTAFDLATDRIATIPIGAEPIGIAIDRAGRRVVATSFRTGTLAMISTATNTLVTTAAVGDTPRAVAVSADGTRAFVTSSSSLLSIVDLTRVGR
jgi:YVTN family beta-propeller protein